MSEPTIWKIAHDDTEPVVFLTIAPDGQRIEFDPAPLLERFNVKARRTAMVNGKLVIETMPADPTQNQP